MVWFEAGVDRISCSEPLLNEEPYLKAATAIDAFLASHAEVRGRDLKCEYTQKSFRAISWERSPLFDQGNSISARRLPSQDVAGISKFCFYGCNETQNWTQEEVISVYKKIYSQTSFTSVYSAYLKPEEDFAESFAFRFLSLDPKNTFVLELNDGSRLDFMAKVRSLNFRKKAEFIDSLLVNIGQVQRIQK